MLNGLCFMALKRLRAKPTVAHYKGSAKLVIVTTISFILLMALVGVLAYWLI